MATYQKTSNLVRKNLPSFTEDYETTILFMEAYYKWMEQSSNTFTGGHPIERLKNFQDYLDIDKTLPTFREYLFNQFLQALPKKILADKSLILKHIKDFVRSRGTEKSYRFLLRVLTGFEDIDFYYPKRDVLRASDGKWYIQKTLRLTNLTEDNVFISITDSETIKLFKNTLITGNVSGATAIIDKGEKFYENGVLIDEITLSSISGTFEAGEMVSSSYTDDFNDTHTLSGDIVSGIVNRIRILERGSGYSVGDPLVFESPYGTGATAEVSDVSTGNIANLLVIFGGAGFKVDDYALFSGGGGSGANATIAVVDTTEFYHPNTYNISSSLIALEANTTIGNTIYTNLSSSNANTKINDATSHFLYANVGPILTMQILSRGDNYVSVPEIDVISNTMIRGLGILGRIDIVNGGTGYVIGEDLIFNQPIGGFGTGAKANVTNVSGAGAITKVTFQKNNPYDIPGGSGYNMNYLPTVTVNTVSGIGATLNVSAILGDGEELTPSVTSIGQILDIRLISGGTGYNVAPTINLSASGDGTANANCTVLTGLYIYPGRYITDDGFLSSDNFLQDRDYYQNFSYVIRMRESLAVYEKAVRNLLHPAGTKMFSEYLFESSNTQENVANSLSLVKHTETIYTPNVIHFDGSSYFSKNTAGFANLSIGNSFNCVTSIWFRLDSLPPGNTEIRLFSMNTVSWLSVRNSSHIYSNSSTGCYIDFRMATASNTTAVQLRSNPNSHPIESNTWIHVLISGNSQNVNQNRIYLSNSNATLIASNSGGYIDFSANDITVGGKTSGSSLFQGDFCEFLFSNSFIDITDYSNRVLFANNYLPTDLTNITSSYPNFRTGLYFKSNAAYANVNSGTGGNFVTITGSWTDSNTSPVDLDR